MNEVVPPKNRGVLVDIHGAALLFGYMLATWIGFGRNLSSMCEVRLYQRSLGFYFYHPANGSEWRAPLGMHLLISSNLGGFPVPLELTSQSFPMYACYFPLAGHILATGEPSMASNE